jgi:hypothetical protein
MALKFWNKINIFCSINYGYEEKGICCDAHDYCFSFFQQFRLRFARKFEVLLLVWNYQTVNSQISPLEHSFYIKRRKKYFSSVLFALSDFFVYKIKSITCFMCAITRIKREAKRLFAKHLNYYFFTKRM